MSIHKIGVLGAGTMGVGVALDLALHGYEVMLYDISKQALVRAVLDFKNQYREVMFFSKLKSKIPKYEDLLVSTVQDLKELSSVDFIIENIPESILDKKVLLENVSQIVDPKVCIAINTSCIPITELASCYVDPARVIGMHFMNPAPLQKFVEIILGLYTAEETLLKAKELAKKLEKKYVLVNDSPGFVSNRLSHLLMNEAIYTVFEGIAQPGDVDRIFKEGYGHKMGPLETADLIGLDTVKNSLNILYEQFQDPKFRCCPLLSKMVSGGKLGKKSGEGFYVY